MAFTSTGLLFAVAHNAGGTPSILRVQVNPALVVHDGLSTIATVGGEAEITAGLISGGGGGAPVSALQEVFSLVPAGGLDWVVEVDLDGLAALAVPALKNNIINTFILGGTLTLTVASDAPTGSESVTIRLRALKTADFVLGASGTANQAHVAHHPGVTGSNLEAPVSETYSAAITGAGYSASGITLTTEGHLVLPVMGAPPLPASSGTLVLTLTETSVGPHMSSELSVELYLPTELILLLDCSGSMGAGVGPSSTKWGIAADIGSVFSLVFGSAVPPRSVVGGTVATLAGYYRTAVGHFQAPGGVPSLVLGAFASASTAPAVPATSPDAPSMTPIGQSLSDAATHFTSGRWRRREIVLLTDGMENVGSPLLGGLAAAGTFPSIADDPDTGILLHNISYARTGDVPVGALSTVVASHNGTYDSTETEPADALSPKALRSAFLSRLPDIAAIEHDGPEDGITALHIEDGVERAVFLATEASLALGVETGGSAVAGTAGSGHGHSWFIVDNPEAGSYTVTNGGAPLSVSTGTMVFYDLRLRTRFGAEASGLGQPILLWAEIRHCGAPVRGADVRLVGHSPGEALGEVLSNAVSAGLFTKAARTKLIDKDVLWASMAVAQGKWERQCGAGEPTIDYPSVQSLLLRAEEAIRHLEFQHSARAIQLSEVSPGRYETTVSADDTQNENLYAFEFRATGCTPGGKEFRRHYRSSVVLPPVPDPVQSSTAMVNTALPGTPAVWVAAALPRTVTGKPLGPGLVPQLSFQFLDAADRKKLGSLEITDNLDGTYLAKLPDHPDKLPKLGLFWGDADRGGVAIVVVPEGAGLRKVQVRLQKIRVLDDKDPCLKGNGELVFCCSVGPDSNPARIVSTRLPAKGHYSVSSGQEIDVDEVIFSGIVEENATLTIAIAGEELDWPECLDRNDPLARYLRRVPVPSKTVTMTPNDESDDPEALLDWWLWYTIEVE